MTKYILGFVMFFTMCYLHAQRKDIKGKLIAKDDVEGIHVLNKTASKFTISNADGSFIIKAKALDTLFISSLKYENKTLIVTQANEETTTLSVSLVEKINALNKVVVGSKLTGSLQADLENSEYKPDINFYDLGIPGNTKLPLTQNERRLYDADAGSLGNIGLGFGVNFNKLLNTISGRTKKLRAIVRLDNKEKCIKKLRANYEAILFEKDTLTEPLKNEYFFFAQEGDNFLKLCKDDNKIALLEYLQQQLIAYRKNRASKDND